MLCETALSCFVMHNFMTFSLYFAQLFLNIFILKYFKKNLESKGLNSSL